MKKLIFIILNLICINSLFAEESLKTNEEPKKTENPVVQISEKKPEENIAPEFVSKDCKMGAYLTSIHAINGLAGTFDATMWVWSVCPKKEHDPIKTIEFVNANKVTTSLYSQTEKGKFFWGQIKVDGTFRHHWDFKNFPFDIQQPKITLEESVDDFEHFSYKADAKNSNFDLNMQIPGWNLTKFKTVDGSTKYNTTYGDPTLTGGVSEYNKIEISFNLARTDLNEFFNLTAPVYAAFLLSLVSFFITLDKNLSSLSPRMSLLSASLFATVISMRSVSSVLGSQNGLSIVSKIHMVTLPFLLLATVATVFFKYKIDRGLEPIEVMKKSHKMAFLFAIIYLLINFYIISMAASNSYV